MPSKTFDFLVSGAARSVGRRGRAKQEPTPELHLGRTLLNRTWHSGFSFVPGPDGSPLQIHTVALFFGGFETTYLEPSGVLKTMVASICFSKSSETECRMVNPIADSNI